MAKYIQNNDIIYLVYNPKYKATVTEEDSLNELSASELINEVEKWKDQ